MKRSIILSVLLFAVLFFMQSFNRPLPNQSGDFIVVAISMKPITCSGQSWKRAFSYEYEVRSGNYDFSATLEKAKSRAMYYAGVPESELVVKYGREPVACVISYDREYPGYGCSVRRFTVGFGKTKAEAESDAAKAMRSDYREASYSVEQFLGSAY